MYMFMHVCTEREIAPVLRLMWSLRGALSACLGEVTRSFTPATVNMLGASPDDLDPI